MNAGHENTAQSLNKQYKYSLISSQLVETSLKIQSGHKSELIQPLNFKCKVHQKRFHTAIHYPVTWRVWHQSQVSFQSQDSKIWQIQKHIFRILQQKVDYSKRQQFTYQQQVFEKLQSQNSAMVLLITSFEAGSNTCGLSPDSDKLLLLSMYGIGLYQATEQTTVLLYDLAVKS